MTYVSIPRLGERGTTIMDGKARADGYRCKAGSNIAPSCLVALKRRWTPTY